MRTEHIVSALQEKRTLIANLADRIEHELAQHRAELEHIDAVLRIFSSDCRSTEINSTRIAGMMHDGTAANRGAGHASHANGAANGVSDPHAAGNGRAENPARKASGRKKQQPRYFRRGELPQLCLEVLNSASGSLLQSDGIAEAINQKKGFVSAADRFKAATATQTRPVLRTLAKRGVVRRVGTGKGSKWRLATPEGAPA